MRKSQLPVRDDVETVTYHRPPTKSELAFGYGATHYRDFAVNECIWPDKTLKAWLKADDDGLRYYR